MIKRSFKKANILTENIIFILLNLVFLSILILFIFSKAGSAAVLEERYAKEIALLIDSAKPVMEITLNMQDALKEAKKNNFDKKNIVTITDNLVTVKLREKGGYSYSYFNNVDAFAFPQDENFMAITINKKNEL